MELMERMEIVKNCQIRFNNSVKEDIARLRAANTNTIDA